MRLTRKIVSIIPYRTCRVWAMVLSFALFVPQMPAQMPGGDPTGACCFDEDYSCVETTEEDCGGDYLGDGTICDPDGCCPPPSSLSYLPGAAISAEAWACAGREKNSDAAEDNGQRTILELSDQIQAHAEAHDTVRCKGTGCKQVEIAEGFAQLSNTPDGLAFSAEFDVRCNTWVAEMGSGEGLPTGPGCGQTNPCWPASDAASSVTVPFRLSETALVRLRAEGELDCSDTSPDMCPSFGASICSNDDGPDCRTPLLELSRVPGNVADNLVAGDYWLVASSECLAFGIPFRFLEVCQDFDRDELVADVTFTMSINGGVPRFPAPYLGVFLVGGHVDVNGVGEFVFEMTNMNDDDDIRVFYMDIEAGLLKNPIDDRAEFTQLPDDWSANNCTEFDDNGHALFKITNDRGHVIVPGQTLQGRLRILTNDLTQDTNKDNGTTVPALSVVLSVAQDQPDLPQEEISWTAVCAPGDYTFGPTTCNGIWSEPLVSTAFLPIAALSTWAKAVLLMVIVVCGTLLVLRSRRPVATSR